MMAFNKHNMKYHHTYTQSTTQMCDQLKMNCINNFPSLLCWQFWHEHDTKMQENSFMMVFITKLLLLSLTAGMAGGIYSYPATWS